MNVIKRPPTQPHSPALEAAAQAVMGKEPRAICFFNNKGGVGKTTLVANLAAQLALNTDLKILVVDADPQCNLTQYVLDSATFFSTYQGEADFGSIYSVIHPLSMGKGYTSAMPVRSSAEFGFDFILGDPRLALKEDLLAQDWRDAKAGGTRGLRTTFVFSDLIRRALNYNLVFFDMGPSLGAINRAILLAAHHFAVPMSIDIFSLWAIRNIGAALRIWKKELVSGIKLAEDPAEVPTAWAPNRPTFLGYVTQQHKERREKGDTKIVEAYHAIGRSIPTEVSDQLSHFFPTTSNFDAHLGDIKHLGSLAPKSQTLHTPMISVSLRGSYTSLRAQARTIYNNISIKFLRNLASSHIS